MKYKYLKHTKTGKIVTMAYDYNDIFGSWIELDLSDADDDQPYFAEEENLKRIMILDEAIYNNFCISAELDKAIVDGEIEICEVTL